MNTVTASIVSWWCPKVSSPKRDSHMAAAILRASCTGWGGRPGVSAWSVARALSAMSGARFMVLFGATTRRDYGLSDQKVTDEHC